MNNTNASKQYTIALCGNPNCGKTTLFNLLTGMNQKVGNWPGVTVEHKSGTCKLNNSLCITDTPGIYSLLPYTPDEQVSCDFLSHGNPSLILNVVDCTSLQRSLFLTTQLLELEIPLIVALNMSDEAELLGIEIDANKLSEEFGVPFAKISAAKNTGIEPLIQLCEKSVHRQHARHALGSTAKSDAFTEADARKRYEKIASVLNKSTSRTATDAKITKRKKLSEKIDAIVLNKWLAFPVFALVMTAIFYLSAGGPGAFLTKYISNSATPLLQTAASQLFSQIGSPQLASLVSDGIVAGVMSVVSFLPQVLILFGLISALEASGYMSRIALITDRALRSIGLNGRSFVSLFLGCGCSVPAIFSARTIKNSREKEATITLTPFMPCSAKLAIIAYFTANLFEGNALIAVSFYFLSLLAIALGGLMLKLFHKQDHNALAFALELPVYRLPKFSNVAKQMYERGKSFLTKAGTVIFAASVVLWFLQHFDVRLQWTVAENSILATVGKIIAPLFYPLGFNDAGCGWQFAIATLSGISAKETVVTTLQLLLPTDARQCISDLGAYSFVVYNLLTAPCIAAISASFSEQGIKSALRSLLFQTTTAYCISLAIYQFGSAYLLNPQVFATTTICVAIATLTILAIAFMLKTNGSCKNCRRCTNCNRTHNCRKH